MKLVKIGLILLLLSNQILFRQSAYAAFDIQPVKLFQDGNICINKSTNGVITVEALKLSTIVTNSESVKSRPGSSGSFCAVPPFFSGGLKLTTTNNITTQAEPVVQGQGRGILISEVAGDQGGVSSSGDPTGFNTFFMTLGSSISNTIFEIALPPECDVIDDDNDIVGTGLDLSLINDFSFPTCDATSGVSVVCNSENGLLTTANGLEPASSGQPAKIRFVLSEVGTTTDINMIDSILLKLDSQDIFCPSSIMGSIIATITAKNAVSNPSLTSTLGTVDLGTLTTAGEINYASETATSTKGETSTNQIGTTPLLVGGSSATANKIEIKELHEDSIPIGGQSSPAIINPLSTNTSEINNINIWLVPSSIGLFANPPSSSDISFSDSSLVLNGDPLIVMTNADDFNAPFGTVVIPVKKNPNVTDPSTVKTTITVNNLMLAVPSEGDSDSTLTLSFFEPVSGAAVNIPGAVSLNNSTNTSNPRNFSAFGVSSTRALAQNVVVGGAVNESTSAVQIQTDANLSFLTQRNTELGAPQIIGFTKVISTLTSVDINKVSVSNNNSVLTVSGSKDASIPGAKVKISSNNDDVTITSTKDGSFTAKLQADFSKGSITFVTLDLKQTVSGTESASVSTQVLKESNELSCKQTVCGCENIDCRPSVNDVLTYIESNGGLASVVLSGGLVLNEVIDSIKKALGLS